MPTVQVLQSSIFMIKFDCGEDLAWVLEKGPWMMEGTKPFMLRCWDDGLGLDMRSFETVPVWVKLLKLHPWFRSNHMLCRI